MPSEACGKFYLPRAANPYKVSVTTLSESNQEREFSRPRGAGGLQELFLNGPDQPARRGRPGGRGPAATPFRSTGQQGRACRRILPSC